MSQRVGSILVCVKDPGDWQKLYDMKIDESWWLSGETGKDVFGDVDGTIWSIDGDWSPEFGNGLIWYSGLGMFIDEIAHRIGWDNCVILASLTDINVDPFELIYTCIGTLEHKNVAGLFGAPPIRNILEWLEWAKIKLTPERMMHLYQFKDLSCIVKEIMPVKFIAPEGADNRQGRMFISVKDPSQWKKAASLDLSDPAFGLPSDFSKQLVSVKDTDFVFDQPWHIDFGRNNYENPLRQLIKKLKQRLGNAACVILSECADPAVSPFYRIVYNIDGSINAKQVIAPLNEARINDVSSWLRLAGLKLDQKKTEYLQAFPSKVFEFTRPNAGKNGTRRNDGLNGLTFAVTGNVNMFGSRNELQQYIEANGGKLSGTVSSKTNYLITNTPNSGSSKNRQAQTLGIPVITEEQFIEMFGASAPRAAVTVASSPADASVLVIPEGTRTIEKGLFKEKKGIVRVVLPDSVTVICENAFNKCADLEEIVFSKNLKEIKKAAFNKCLKLKEITLPEKLEILGERAFYGCKQLSSVHLNDSLHEIGPQAFMNCLSLEEIHIPNKVTTLCYRLLQGCKKLRNASFSERVREIGGACFEGCESLTEVTLPSTLEHIGSEVFKECTSLETVHIEPMPQLKEADSYMFAGTRFESKMEEKGQGIYLGRILVSAAGNTICVREGTTDISMYALRNIRSLTLPASLKQIRFFYWAMPAYKTASPLEKTLEEVVLSSGFTRIDRDAFYDLKNLRVVTIPETVIEIDEDAFVFGELIDGKLRYGKLSNLTIRGVAGSAAERFAAENGYHFAQL